MFYLSNNTKIVVYGSKLMNKLGVTIKGYRRAIHHGRRDGGSVGRMRRTCWSSEMDRNNGCSMSSHTASGRLDEAAGNTERYTWPSSLLPNQLQTRPPLCVARRDIIVHLFIAALEKFLWVGSFRNSLNGRPSGSVGGNRTNKEKMKGLSI